ncbi:hypothetical protein Syun_002203 [Stephania yunnanensis]|uniref:Protein kinase domain-containing protein n=1 Tax=Stephania yunnanensis TaxID=152371 RepID=A0AAP0Q7T8_9MAGN
MQRKSFIQNRSRWVSLCSFSFKELEKATYGFEEKLGSGAFATAYKGLLLSNGEKHIAVKRLDMIPSGVANKCEKLIRQFVWKNMKRTHQMR